jgi:hypothetical protein
MGGGASLRLLLLLLPLLLLLLRGHPPWRWGRMQMAWGASRQGWKRLRQRLRQPLLAQGGRLGQLQPLLALVAAALAEGWAPL